jgi:hypothetical protein
MKVFAAGASGAIGQPLMSSFYLGGSLVCSPITERPVGNTRIGGLPSPAAFQDRMLRTDKRRWERGWG